LAIYFFGYLFIFDYLKIFNKEFKSLAQATAVGFLTMGFIGFFVKLIHIPINNIIIGTG